MRRMQKVCTTILTTLMILNAFQTLSIARSKEDVELQPESELDGALQPKEIPEGRLLDVDGEKYWCYTKPEFQALGHVLVDYDSLFLYTAYLEERQETFSKDILTLQGKVNTWKSEAKSQKDRAEFLSNLWDTEHKLRLRMDKKNNAWRVTPWVIVIIESVVFAGISAYVLAESSN